MSLPPQHTPELFGVGITFCNCNIVRQLETDTFVDLAWPFEKPSVPAGCLPESLLLKLTTAVLLGITRFGQLLPPLFSVFPSVLASTTSVQQTTFLSRHFPLGTSLDGSEEHMEEMGGSTQF